MWKSMGDPSLRLMMTHNDDSYHIMMTDFIIIWATYLSKAEFLQVLKASNVGLELKNDDLFIQKGIHLLSNPEKLRSLETKKENEILHVTMTMCFGEDDGKILHATMTMCFGYLFRLDFKLAQESAEFYFHKVTLPLLKTIQDLHSSQNELRDLLKKKDIELDEYKSEGTVIALRHIRTERYDDDAHMSKYKVYKEHFGNSSIVKDCLVNANKRKPEDPNNSIVKQELSTSIKLEPLVGNDLVKLETNCSIKNEPQTQVSETQNSTVTNNINIKLEIKTESQAITPKKRQKKKFNF